MVQVCVCVCGYVCVTYALCITRNSFSFVIAILINVITQSDPAGSSWHPRKANKKVLITHQLPSHIHITTITILVSHRVSCWVCEDENTHTNTDTVTQCGLCLQQWETTLNSVVVMQSIGLCCLHFVHKQHKYLFYVMYSYLVHVIQYHVWQKSCFRKGNSISPELSVFAHGHHDQQVSQDAH